MNAQSPQPNLAIESQFQANPTIQHPPQSNSDGASAIDSQYQAASALQPQPNPAGAAAIELQRDIHYVAVDALRRSLPPPNEDTPDGWARRDRVAIATVACLVPVNPVETNLAAQHVATMELASAARQEAVRLDLADPRRAAQCRAQSASLGREARGFLGKLLQAQAARTKREANPVTCDSAGWTEHRMVNLMTEALESLPPLPPPGPAPLPAEATPPGSAAAIQRPPAGTPPPGTTTPAPAKPPKAPWRDFDDFSDAEKHATKWRWKADHYAENHPQRTRLIRLYKGLPPGADFALPEPDLLHAIITGTGQLLVEKDALDPDAA